MLLTATVFAAQLINAGMTSANARTANILERLEDPEGTYTSHDSWSQLDFPGPWLDPAKTKLIGIIASPITFLLCLPLFVLNQRSFSFSSLLITSFLTIPLGLFYIFFSVYETNWLVLLVPSSLSTTPLALRILVAIAPSIIAALFFALVLSHLENFASRNKWTEDDEQKKTTTRWTESPIPFIFALLILLVTVGGFLIISTNLMMTLSSGIPDCSSRYNFGCEYGHSYGSDQAVAAFVTFSIAHLALSTTIMVIALLVFLVGHNISRLTSCLLGCNTFGLTVATVVYYVLCLRGFMEPLEFDIYNTEFVFMSNTVVGLLVGSIFMLKGRKASVELLAFLLNAFLILPLLLLGLAILVIARGIFSLANLTSTKVTLYFHECTVTLIICILQDSDNETETKETV